MQDWSWKTRFEVFPKKKSVPTLVQANYRRFSDNDNKMIDVNIKDDVNDNNDNNDNSNGTAPTMNNNNNNNNNTEKIQIPVIVMMLKDTIVLTLVDFFNT